MRADRPTPAPTLSPGGAPTPAPEGDPGGRQVACSVWWATAGPVPRAAASWLDDHENRRADGFRRPADRDRYVAAHALVRRVVGARTGVRPQHLRLDVTCHRCGLPHGKPRLGDSLAGAPVSFSISHSGDRVVVALTDGRPVGVDVDAPRHLDREQLAMMSTQILSLSERVSYAEFPVAERAHALAVWWSRKEAVLKATGEGLAVPPAHVSVSDPASAPAVTGWDPGTPWPGGAAPEASLRDLTAPSPYVCSVAVLGAGDLDVREHDGDALLR